MISVNKKQKMVLFFTKQKKNHPHRKKAETVNVSCKSILNNQEMR